MGFTPDQLPAIGFLRPGVAVAAGYNGYGGSYTTSAGQAAALMAIARQVPEWIPEDVFSPRRLLSDTPLFLQEQDSLWRIATSLCCQLRTVNRQIAQDLNHSQGRNVKNSFLPSAASRMRRISQKRITVNDIKSFAALRRFTLAELKALLDLLRGWEAPRGTLICPEGDPGGTCFFVIRGAVDVTIQVLGRPQLLARLLPNQIFGQVSLIDGDFRSAACIASSDTVLAAMTRNTCARLFKSRSQMALKFLGALNDGIISALRGADRRLLRLNRGQFEDSIRSSDPEVSSIPPFQF